MASQIAEAGQCCARQYWQCRHQQQEQKHLQLYLRSLVCCPLVTAPPHCLCRTIRCSDNSNTTTTNDSSSGFVCCLLVCYSVPFRGTPRPPGVHRRTEATAALPEVASLPACHPLSHF